jgi:hypothetical protein
MNTSTLREAALAAYREEEARLASVEARQRAEQDDREAADLLLLAIQFFGDFIPVLAGGVRPIEVVWAADENNFRPWRPTIDLAGVMLEPNRDHRYALTASVPRPGCGHREFGRINPGNVLAALGSLLTTAGGDKPCPDCKYEAAEQADTIAIGPREPEQSLGDRLIAVLREAMAPEVPF